MSRNMFQYCCPLHINNFNFYKDTYTGFFFAQLVFLPLMPKQHNSVGCTFANVIPFAKINMCLTQDIRGYCTSKALKFLSIKNRPSALKGKISSTVSSWINCCLLCRPFVYATQKYGADPLFRIARVGIFPRSSWLGAGLVGFWELGRGGSIG